GDACSGGGCGSVGTYGEGVVVDAAVVGPLMGVALGAREIDQRDHVIGIEFESALEVGDGFADKRLVNASIGTTSLPGLDQSEIVPSIGECVGKAGAQFHGLPEGGARFGELLLVEI